MSASLSPPIFIDPMSLVAIVCLLLVLLILSVVLAIFPQIVFVGGLQLSTCETETTANAISGNESVPRGALAENLHSYDIQTRGNVMIIARNCKKQVATEVTFEMAHFYAKTVEIFSVFNVTRTYITICAFE